MSARGTPPVPVKRLRHRVCALADMRAWEALIDEAHRALAHEPDNAHIYAHLAQALLHQKRHDESLRAADAAIRLDPNREWAHRLRSLILTGLDRHAEALQSATEAVRLSPESISALHRLANCQGMCRQWTEMARTARRYERLVPDHETAHHLRGEALWGLGDVEGARAAFQTALSIDPRCASLHEDMGHMALHDGRTDDAIEHFLQSLRLRPDAERAEAGLLYAVRRYLDAGQLTGGDDAAPAVTARTSSVLGTHVHVLALRVPAAYRRLFNTDPPPLAYHPPFSADDAHEFARALAEWRSGSRDETLRVLAALGLPADLARSLAEGRTTHHPAGLSLDDLIRHWIVAVLDRERGNPRDMNDLRHDRLVRDAIEAVAATASLSLRQKIRSALEPWDRRFHAGQE